jgi:hypothetical protein
MPPGGGTPGAVFADVDAISPRRVEAGARGAPSWPGEERSACVGFSGSVRGESYLRRSVRSIAARLWYVLRAWARREWPSWTASRSGWRRAVPSRPQPAVMPRLRARTPELPSCRRAGLGVHRGRLVAARAASVTAAKRADRSPGRPHSGATNAPFTGNLERPVPSSTAGAARSLHGAGRRAREPIVYCGSESRPATTSSRCTWPASVAGYTPAPGASGAATHRCPWRPAKAPLRADS